eukprot:scaffold1106_cov126-Cylindrotheca_fusiformis.AAC.4
MSTTTPSKGGGTDAVAATGEDVQQQELQVDPVQPEEPEVDPVQMMKLENKEKQTEEKGEQASPSENDIKIINQQGKVEDLIPKKEKDKAEPDAEQRESKKKEEQGGADEKKKKDEDGELPPPPVQEKEENTSDEEQKMEHAMQAEREKADLDQRTLEEQRIVADRLQAQLNFNRDHPHGVTLLARDNTNNRRLFPNGPFGTIDVAETDCAQEEDEDGRCPYYSMVADKGKETTTPIHILIAAFRDKLCARTLHNAFTHATNPSRLFIRVIDQTKKDSELEDDAGCWELYCEKYNTNCQEYQSQVRMVKIDASLSKGPTYARSKLSAMVHWDYVHRDDPAEIDLQKVDLQDFCMQIDSHMDFSDHFDVGLIDMHHRTKNDYSVLSTYVTDIEKNNQDERTVPNLCMVTFTSSIRNWGTKECKYLTRPKLTNAMWGAGLSFHRCHAELVVPVDPYLDNVFDGEEGSRGIRFFTHGYDVYTPDIVLVTHDYKTHQGNPVVHTWGRGAKRNDEDEEGEAGEDGMKLHGDRWKWNDEIEKQRSELTVFGTNRVNMLLGIGSHHNSTEQERRELELIRNSRFGLGTKRTMEQVRTFTGINLLEMRMEENKCGNNYWVPYEESPNYGVDEILARGNIGMVATKSPLASKDQVLNELKKARAKKKSKKDAIPISSLDELKSKDLKGGSSHRGSATGGSGRGSRGRVTEKDALEEEEEVEHVETPKPLLGNPGLRHAAEVLEKDFMAGASAFKAKEEQMLANGEVDFKLVGGVSAIILVLMLVVMSQTSKQRNHKKNS